MSSQSRNATHKKYSEAILQSYLIHTWNEAAMLTSTSNNFTYMPVPVKSLWWGDLIFQMQNGCTMRLNPTEINDLQFVVNIILRWIKTCENDTKWTNCRWRVTKGTNFFMTYHSIDSNESFQTLHYPMSIHSILPAYHHLTVYSTILPHSILLHF